MKQIKLTSVFLVFVCVNLGLDAKLKEKFKWKQISYDWPSEQVKKEAITSGNFIPKNNVPFALSVWNDKLFITIPRYAKNSALIKSFII